MYFAEKGTGIPEEDERTLAQFAQAVRGTSFPNRSEHDRLTKKNLNDQYLDARLNPRMSVAKYCARFELGLTTTVRSSLVYSREC